MDGLGWVDASPNGAYRLTSRGAAGAAGTPPDLDVLLAGLPDHLAGNGAELATWLRRSAVGWSQGEAPHPMSDILDGALLAPVLVELQRRGGPEALSAGEDPFGAEATNELLKLFASRGWADDLSQPQRPQLNAAGIYLVESGANSGRRCRTGRCFDRWTPFSLATHHPCSNAMSRDMSGILIAG